jgi:DNA-binding NarL/FixJ family response regulator
MTSARGSCGPVLIADDDAATVELVRLSLAEAGYETYASASGSDAIALASEYSIGAAVLDVNLPGLSGYEVCRELRRLYGAGIPILFVSGDRTEAYDRIAGLLLGADDYLVKPFDPGELVTRLDGLVFRARSATERRLLTPREHEVLTLLARGLTQCEIAERLTITSKTVATHIERILGKLGVRSRAQAVAIAYRETLVTISA